MNKEAGLFSLRSCRFDFIYVRERVNGKRPYISMATASRPLRDDPAVIMKKPFLTFLSSLRCGIGPMLKMVMIFGYVIIGSMMLHCFSDTEIRSILCILTFLLMDPSPTFEIAKKELIAGLEGLLDKKITQGKDFSSYQLIINKQRSENCPNGFRL
jgi:hypothetical protein